MITKPFFYLITLTIINFVTVSSVNAQVKIDLTAVSVFWEVADTLGMDKNPSADLWKKFANHPAYDQIEKSGNRVSYLKRVLPIVFRPSQSEKLKQLLKGKESFTQYLAKHLQEIKIRREELHDYLRSNKVHSYKDSYIRGLKYLPSDIKKETINLTIYIALFEDNGFGGKVITMDLLHLLKGTVGENRGFFGHEFHHALRKKSNAYEIFKPKDSIYYPIIEALNKLPLEGVASLVDKAKYFSKSYYTQPMSDSQKETVTEFQNLVKNANINLGQIDSILSGSLTNEEKGKQVFKNMPWSGHAIGFYMSYTIEQAFGKEKLIEVQYSCIGFILTYQKASKNQETLYTFSDKTIEFLKSIK